MLFRYCAQTHANLYKMIEAACACSLDPDGGEEGVLCTDSTEAGNLTTQSCSKTWTWGIEGPRYHLIGKKATPLSNLVVEEGSD